MQTSCSRRIEQPPAMPVERSRRRCDQVAFSATGAQPGRSRKSRDPGEAPPPGNQICPEEALQQYLLSRSRGPFLDYLLPLCGTHNELTEAVHCHIECK